MDDPRSFAKNYTCTDNTLKTRYRSRGTSPPIAKSSIIKNQEIEKITPPRDLQTTHARYKNTSLV